MEAVMVLKGVEPTWAEAKKQLGNADFLKEVCSYREGLELISILSIGVLYLCVPILLAG